MKDDWSSERAGNQLICSVGAPSCCVQVARSAEIETNLSATLDGP